MVGNVSHAGKKVLIGGDLTKERLLNPYKRIKLGTEVNVKVDDVDVVAIVDPKQQYTYLNVEGVDCYITGVLTEGTEYGTALWTPKVAVKKVKVAKVEKVEDEPCDGEDEAAAA